MNEVMKIINNNKLLFQQIIKTCQLINHVTKEHTDYILNYQELPIPLFTKTEIESFTKAEFESFNQVEITKFTLEQVK